MDSENSQLINPDGPSQANIDQDMYMGEPQAQFFGRDNGPIIANRGPDLSSFTNTMFSDNQERVQGARNNTNSWENGGPHGNNENPEAVLIASALASAIFPSQPQFDVPPSIPGTVDPRILQHDAGHLQREWSLGQNFIPAPQESTTSESAVHHQRPVLPSSSSGRQSGSRGSPSQSRAGQTTQTRPRASNLFTSTPMQESSSNGQHDTQAQTPNLLKFIHVNASVKRATTEPVKRPTKRTKSAKQPEQPPQPVALQPFHVPKSTKAPNPIQMYLAHQAEKGTYPLQVSHGHLWVNFLAYASLHSLNVEKITPEMFQQEQLIMDTNMMKKAMHIAQHYYGIPKPNNFRSIKTRAGNLLESQFFMHASFSTASPMVVSLFKIEVDDLLNEYSANGACVDEQPNTAPGFEMDTILHFANPIFAEACQEFLELFPQEVLDRLEGCSGILTTSGAFLSTAFQRLYRGRLTWDPWHYDVRRVDEELLSDVRYFIKKSETINIDIERFTTRGGEQHSISEILSGIYKIVKTLAKEEGLATSKGILNPRYSASHPHGHFLRTATRAAEVGPSSSAVV